MIKTMKTQMTEEQEWIFLNKHLDILGNPRSLQHQKSIKILLDEFFDGDVSITENEDLDYQDAYEAFVAILLCMFQVAKAEEEYEMLRKIEKAYNIQHNIIRGFIMNYYDNKEERDENIEWLESGDDFVQEQIMVILNSK